MNELSENPNVKTKDKKPQKVLKKIILFSIPMPLIILFSGLRFLPVSEKLALIGFFAHMLSMLIFVLSVFLFIVAVVAAFTLFKSKKFLIPIGIFVLTLILVVFSFFIVDDFLQEKALDRAVKNAQPIIIALDNYKNVNITYPETLDKLTPKYLQNIPEPNFKWSTEYQYEPLLIENGVAKKDSYNLWIFVTTGFIMGYKFQYNPHQKYPETSDYKIITPRGKWAKITLVD